MPAVIHGRSFPDRHVDENFAASYPPRDPSRFNIGMLHTSLTGFEEHATYAPCTVDDLRAKGYEYWALGHVHTAQEIRSGDPWIVFPGNIQGRSIRETGAKGCRIVTVDDAHRVSSCTFHALDVFRWQQLEIDVTGAASISEVEQSVEKAIRAMEQAPDCRYILRLSLKGESPLAAHLLSTEDWRDSLRALATNTGSERIWLEKIETRCLPPRQTRNLDGPLAEVAVSLRSLNAEEIAELFAPLRQKLPDEAKAQLSSMLDPASPEYAALLAEVEALVSARLGGQAVTHAD